MRVGRVLWMLLGVATMGVVAQVVRGQEPTTGAPLKAGAGERKGAVEGADKAVAALVAELKQHPVLRSKSKERNPLYVVELIRGGVTMIADEPEPGRTHCGTPAWSPNGQRIVFDATEGTDWSFTRLKSLEIQGGRPVLTDLGPGSCPSFSPDGTQVVFLQNPGPVSDADSGVWLMKADGTARRRLSDAGRPRWSPDGRRIMVTTFESPCEITLVDVATGEERPLRTPDHQVYSAPSWADGNTIVAVVGAQPGETIALLDVSDPNQVKLERSLWTLGDGLSVVPSYPIYSPATRRCVFVGAERKGSALFCIEEGKSSPPERLEPEGFDPFLSDLTFSPDGRYVVFGSNKSDRP
jgi:Tol biopolymer transport system component